jgi:hypothetical protein
MLRCATRQTGDRVDRPFVSELFEFLSADAVRTEGVEPGGMLRNWPNSSRHVGTSERLRLDPSVLDVGQRAAFDWTLFLVEFLDRRNFPRGGPRRA